MTNNQIILQHAITLMEQGVIGSTGRTFTVEEEDGSQRTVQEPEPIHTFAAWRSLGYTVRKGQKACAKFPIWRHQAAGTRKSRKTGEEESTEEKMYLTDAFFFSLQQLEPIEEK